MNRNDFRELALMRLSDARVLLKNGHYEGAYYLCGYVVECALKACIAKQTRRHDFPDKKTVEASYTHVLSDLVKTAGLGVDLDKEMNINQHFADNWDIVKDWSEVSRYEKHGELETRDLYYAVTDSKHGVLRWIRQHW